VVARRSSRRAVPGFVQPRGRSRVEDVDRSHRNLARVEVEISTCHVEVVANAGDRARNNPMVEVRTPDCDREDKERRQAAFGGTENGAVGFDPSLRGRRVRRSKDRDRVAGKRHEVGNRVADKDREARNDREKTQRRDREAADPSAEEDRVGSRRVGSRPSDRRRAACNRVRRVRRDVGSDLSGRLRFLPIFLRLPDTKPPGHRALLDRLVPDPRYEIFRRRYRVR